MTPFLRKLLGLNWLLLATMLALAIFGVVAIYSATYMRGDYGIGAVSNSISRDASDAAVAFVWSDRRSSLPSNSDATGSRGSDHLGTSAPGAVVRRWASAALLNLYHSHRARLYPNRNQSWSKTVPAATNHRLYSSRYRQARSSLGDQSVAHCDWVGRLVGKRIQGTKYPNRAWVFARDGSTQRLHCFRDWRAVGICRRDVSHRRVFPATVNLSLRRICCGRSIGLTPGHWSYCAHLHPYLSEYGYDDLDAANHGRAAAVDQLQRLIRADDHVWTRTCEQRLGPPTRRPLILGKIFRRSTTRSKLVGRRRLLYAIGCLESRNAWKAITRSSSRFSKDRSISCFT